MNADIARLRELQTVDDAIAHLEADFGALPKRVAAIDQKLAAAKTDAETKKKESTENDKRRRSLEDDIKTSEQKIAKYKLQSQDVKTNEQYRALQHEIEFAQVEIRKFEDGVLECMEKSEALASSLQHADAALAQQVIDMEREKHEARAQAEQGQKELAVAKVKRNELRAAIAGDVVEHYDRISKRLKPAVTEALEYKCTACFLALRPQRIEELKGANQIITCEQCSRILYYDPAHEPAKPEPPKKKAKANVEEALNEAASQ